MSVTALEHLRERHDVLWALQACCFVLISQRGARSFGLSDPTKRGPPRERERETELVNDISPFPYCPSICSLLLLESCQPLVGGFFACWSSLHSSGGSECRMPYIQKVCSPQTRTQSSENPTEFSPCHQDTAHILLLCSLKLPLIVRLVRIHRSPIELHQKEGNGLFDTRMTRH